MVKISKLKELLQAQKFQGAAQLLKGHLFEASIIDPSEDWSWAQYADGISSNILVAKGRGYFNLFWEDLLNFFLKDLEPVWGHLHKGHIYFRLGLGKIVEDVSSGKAYLEKALDEDRLLENNRAAGKSIDIEKEIEKYSAYTYLCIIERIEDEEFSSGTERQKFFEELLPTAFDAEIFGRRVDPAMVRKAIKNIVPVEGWEMTIVTEGELGIADANRLKIGVISLAGSLAENILLSILYHKMNIIEINTGQGMKDIRRIELGPLLNEAITRSIFPTESIKAVFRLIHIFRNRLHPGNELRQTYKLTGRVATNLKLLLDLALVEWGKQ